MSAPRDYGPAFAAVGILPDGDVCKCGETVRFDVLSRRLEHFMVCPVVDAVVTERQAELVANLVKAGKIPEDEEGTRAATQLARMINAGRVPS